MPGLDLLAEEQPNELDLFAASEPVTQPTQAVAPVRPSMADLFAKYTAGEFNPTQSQAFEELARRRFSGSTMGISAGSPFKPEAPQAELSPRQQAMAELAADTGISSI